MDPASFAIVLFACAHGGEQCRPVATEAAVFATREACVAELDSALDRGMTIDSPWVEAECRTVAKIPARLKSELVKTPNSRD